MVLVITGERGVGKTTLLKEVIAESERDFYGILSERFDDGYEVKDVRTGERKVLCSKKCIGFKFRGFYFDPATFDFIKESLKREGDILVYDEVGYLESEGYLCIFEYIREPAILIVREELVDVVSSRFNVEVFEVTRENREEMKGIILKKVTCMKYVNKKILRI